MDNAASRAWEPNKPYFGQNGGLFPLYRSEIPAYSKVFWGVQPTPLRFCEPLWGQDFVRPGMEALCRRPKTEPSVGL